MFIYNFVRIGQNYFDGPGEENTETVLDGIANCGGLKSGAR